MNQAKLRKAINDLRAELDHLEAALGDRDTPTSGDLRIYQFLAAIEERGSVSSPDELSALGRAKGYNPQGLGGYFSGHRPTLHRNDDGSTILTDEGRRWLDNMRARYAL